MPAASFFGFCRLLPQFLGAILPDQLVYFIPAADRLSAPLGDDLHRALVEPIEVEQAPELARQYHILTLPRQF
jgi:hypothetical protein